jgi:hypothetical protein
LFIFLPTFFVFSISKIDFHLENIHLDEKVKPNWIRFEPEFKFSCKRKDKTKMFSRGKSLHDEMRKEESGNGQIHFLLLAIWMPFGPNSWCVLIDFYIKSPDYINR